MEVKTTKGLEVNRRTTAGRHVPEDPLALYVLDVPARKVSPGMDRVRASQWMKPPSACTDRPWTVACCHTVRRCQPRSSGPSSRKSKRALTDCRLGMSSLVLSTRPRWIGAAETRPRAHPLLVNDHPEGVRRLGIVVEVEEDAAGGGAVRLDDDALDADCLADVQVRLGARDHRRAAGGRGCRPGCRGLGLTA